MIKYSNEIRKEVMKLTREGLSLREVGRKLEVSKSYVHKVLKEESSKEEE